MPHHVLSFKSAARSAGIKERRAMVEPAAAFQARIAKSTSAIAGHPLDRSLEDFLNRTIPADGELFKTIAADCRQAIQDGWMCNREHGGIRYGRVIKPSETIHGFSVDVVHMQDIAGPHHRHPQGEIDMI